MSVCVQVVCANISMFSGTCKARALVTLGTWSRRHTMRCAHHMYAHSRGDAGSGPQAFTGNSITLGFRALTGSKLGLNLGLPWTACDLEQVT